MLLQKNCYLEGSENLVKGKAITIFSRFDKDKRDNPHKEK
jgi:hypothetical protein